MSERNGLKMISVVVPSFNEEDNVKVLYEEVAKQLKSQKFEIIYVDDGSTDDTLKNLKKLAAKYKNVKYISFSRNFGHQSALRAGLKYAQGDAVISMDADLQHPPKLLPKLIEHWREGYDVVYTRRNDKEAENISFFKKTTSSSFYKLMNRMSGLNIDPGAADFRLLDRRVVGVINSFTEPNLFLRGLIDWLGYKSKAIDYVPAKRFSGKSKYSFKKMFSFAVNGITQFSVKPLRLSIGVGLTFAFLGAIYGIYTLIDYFAAGNVVSGWTSLVIIILITSGIQLVLLGVVAEYVGKTFVQTKHRPDYLVHETNVE